MKQHYVTFYSPGTFTAETTRKPITSWDVAQAKEMAKSIDERYGAKPYGFQFMTRERGEHELDSHESAASAMYYLGGEIVTIDTIRERHDPDERILLSNMEGNGWDRVLFNTNSWKVVLPLNDGDVVLEWFPS